MDKLFLKKRKEVGYCGDVRGFKVVGLGKSNLAQKNPSCSTKYRVLLFEKWIYMYLLNFEL